METDKQYPLFTGARQSREYASLEVGGQGIDGFRSTSLEAGKLTIAFYLADWVQFIFLNRKVGSRVESIVLRHEEPGFDRVTHKIKNAEYTSFCVKVEDTGPTIVLVIFEFEDDSHTIKVEFDDSELEEAA